MKQTKHFKRTAFNLSAKSMVSLMLLLIAMLMPQGVWAGACAYTPGCASLEDMQVHLNGTNGNFNGSANNEVVASLKFNYWLDIFNYDGDNGYWDRDLTMKIDGQTLTFYSDYACTTKVSTDYSTVLHGVWGVFGDSNEDHTIGKNKSGSGNKAYFKTSSGLKGYINIYNYYAASNKWTTMKVEVFIYDLYGHKVSVCGTYKRSGKSDIAYDYVFYLGGCPRPKNVTTSQSTTKKEVTVSWQKETYSIPASDATSETRVKAYNVIDNGSWGVYRNNNYNTSILTVGNTATSAADNSASCSSSPYTYNVCYEPKATYGSNGTSLKGDVTSQRGISGSKSITLTHVWSNSGSLKDAATCTAAAVYYQKCIYCGSTSDANHTYTSGSALGHGSTGYTDSYSWTGNAYNDASQDTKACTFTLTCKKCSTKVVNGASLKCTKTAHVDALCTATGSTTYQATGSYTAANSAYNYSATKTNVYTVAALGHGTTGFTESYSWTGNAYNNPSQDTKACIFTLTCKKCSTKVVNGASLTCTMTSHVNATCTATGSTTYRATGSYTAANSHYNYSSTNTHVYTVAALGHGSTGYTDSYSWTGNAYNDASQDTKACTFTLTCNKCSTKVVNGASLTCTKTAHVDALCTATGSTTYQATGSYTAANSAYNYSATKTNVYTVAALGHGSTGYTPTYTWGGTYDDATCTFTLQCGSCGAEVFNDNITTTKVPHNYVDVTCGKDGNIRWTATGSYSKAGDATYNGEAQVKDYAIPATGLHTFDDDDPAQSVCTVCNHGFFRYTAMAKVEPKKPAELKNAEGMSIYNADKHSFADGMGVMEFDEPLVTIGQLAFLNGFDFTENLTIPNTVTTIGHGAFQSCFRLTGNLIIPNSVTSIGPIAFAGCRFSGNLILPNSVTSIGSDAFDGCNFNNITLQSIPVVQNRAFYHNVGYDEENDIAIDINYPITISLSDNSYVYTGENPYFPTVASVTFNRYFVNDGGMYSFIVPFDIPAAQAAELGKFYQYSKHEEGKVYFDNADGIVRANTAYFFEPAKDITSITVENPTFGNTGTMPDATNPSEPGLYGTYSQIDIPVGAYGYAMHWGESTFVKAGTGNLLRSFRAYLWLGSGASMAKTLAFFGDYDDITGINNIETDTDLDMSKPIYTLSGQRIMTPKKGEIYIQNGKKVIKK